MSELWRRSSGHFRGHRVHCAPGTHEAAVALLMKHVTPGPGVLDLGSGSGALLARLADAGFSDLHGAKRDLEVFGTPETPGPDGASFAERDLNADFERHYTRRFALVVSSEVIEHLESPRDFLRRVRGLIEPGGHLLLTTPNVANWVGRLRFLVLGELRWFDEPGYRRLRHISPIADVQMRLMLEELGFDLVDATSAGSFMGPLQKLATAPLSLPFLAVFGRRVWGDCNVYLARRSGDA
jgi:2-polyprenyl-3-methyl-5-hydroxy-6-metoxy-1,4-benzoquinol methylase